MNSKVIKNNKIHRDLLKPTRHNHFCEVSKASSEIMLDRFCNGKEVGFPFSI